MDAYRQTAKRRERAEKEALKKKHWRAWHTAEKAADLLKTSFGVAQVSVFGSLCHPDLFHSRSDIDLAVWELPPESYFRAVGILQSIDPEFAIDLIEYERASERLRQIIESEGEII